MKKIILLLVVVFCFGMVSNANAAATFINDSFTGATFHPGYWKELETAVPGRGPSAGNMQQSGNQLLMKGTGASPFGANGLETISTYDHTTSDLYFSATITPASCSLDTLITYGDKAIQTGAVYVLFLNGAQWELLYFNNGSYITSSFITGANCSGGGTPITLTMKILQAGGVQVFVNGSGTAGAQILQGNPNNKTFYIGKYAPGGFATVSNVTLTAPNYVNVPSSPYSLVLTPNDGTLGVNWEIPVTDGGSPITDYIIEYKQSGTAIWSIYNDGVSTANSAVLTLPSGVGYDVRIYARNAIGDSLVSRTISSRWLYHVLITGQSLALGELGTPALSTTAPYSNFKLNPANNIITPLVETTKESPASAMGHGLTYTRSDIIAQQTEDYLYGVTNHALQGVPYATLKKGTYSYNLGMSQVTNMKANADTYDLPYRVIAVTAIHGEDDHLIGTSAATYEADLLEWYNDYNTDVKEINGQTFDIPLVTDQFSSWTAYNAATSVIPLAQLAAAENNPGKIYLVGPKYFLDYSPDGVHLINTSYRWLGEYYAKVLARIVNGEAWKPLSPTTIERTNNVITVDFHVPVGSLAIDTTNIDAVPNYGFEYYDDSSSADIQSVTLVDNNTLAITLDAIPTGTNQLLRYAMTGTPGAITGPHTTGTAKGNIRDTDPAVSMSGNNLYDWLVHFEKSVTDVPDTLSPSISSLVVSNVTNDAARITWDTDELSDSQVAYGLTSSVADSTTPVSDTVTKVTSHTVDIGSLSACTTYYVAVTSTDIAGNSTTSAIPSSVQFTTTGCVTPPPPVPTPSSRSRVIGYINKKPVQETVSVTTESSIKYVFPRNLKIGMTGADVTVLQNFLAQQNSGPSARQLANTTARGYFGQITQRALVEYQQKNMIKPSVGFLGPITRKSVESKL
jgi:hypothetical protein